MKSLHQERLQSSDGKDQEDRTNILLTDASGAVVQPYKWTIASHSFDNLAVESDAKGYVQFFANQGIYTLKRDDPQPKFSRTVSLPTPAITFGFPDTSLRQQAYPKPADDTADLQEAINRLSSLYSYGGTGGTIRLGPRVYNITSIILPDDVSLEGVDPSVTGLVQSVDATGPVITSLPITGSRHSLRRLRILGGMAGMTRTISPTVAGTTTLEPDSTASALPGYVVEGVGIAWGTYIISNIPDIRVSEPFTANTSDQNPILFRRACVLTLSGVTNGQYSYSFKYGTIASLSQNMLVSGPDKFGEDVAVKSFTTGGSPKLVFWKTPFADVTEPPPFPYEIVCYVANPGVFVADPKWYNQNWNSTLTYLAPSIDQVQITRCSGDGIRCAANRPRPLIFKGSKIDFCFGRGLSASDCVGLEITDKVGMGNNWRAAIRLLRCSESRIIGTDSWLTEINDKDYDIELDQCINSTIEGGDLNGRLLVRGNDPTIHTARVSGYNFKFKQANLIPIAPFRADAYVVADGATVVLDSPYFLPDGDNAQLLYRPDYLFELSNSARILVDNAHVKSDSATGTPFKLARIKAHSNCKVYGNVADIDIDSWQWYGDTPGLETYLAPLSGEVGQQLQLTQAKPIITGADIITGLIQLELTPGNWELNAAMHVTVATTSAQQFGYVSVGITDVSNATMPSNAGAFAKRELRRAPFNGTLSLTVEPITFAVSGANKTVYLNGQCSSQGTLSANAFLRAVRSS